MEDGRGRRAALTAPSSREQCGPVGFHMAASSEEPKNAIERARVRLKVCAVHIHLRQHRPLLVRQLLHLMKRQPRLENEG